MMHWPDDPPTVLDAREHAAAILEAFEGDWEAAQIAIPMHAEALGKGYAARLEWLLTSQGEA